MSGRYMRWTDADVTILREIWASPDTIESQAHRLPGRTVDHLRQRAASLKLGSKPRSSPGWARIRAALERGLPMTAQELADAADLTAQQACELLNAAVAREQAYVFDFVRVSRNGKAQKRYRLGAGVSVNPPKHFTPEERHKRWLDKQDPQELFVQRRRYYVRKLARAGKLARRDPITAALFGSV